MEKQIKNGLEEIIPQCDLFLSTNRTCKKIASEDMLSPFLPYLLLF